MALIVGGVVGSFALMFAFMLSGFNPNASGRAANAIGFAVIVFLAVTLTVYLGFVGIEWLVRRLIR